MHYGLGGFGGFGITIFWTLLVALFLAAIIFIVMKMLNGNSGSRNSGIGTPMDILRRRYASGEINRDEFEQKKHDLVGR